MKKYVKEIFAAMRWKKFLYWKVLWQFNHKESRRGMDMAFSFQDMVVVGKVLAGKDLVDILDHDLMTSNGMSCSLI